MGQISIFLKKGLVLDCNFLANLQPVKITRCRVKLCQVHNKILLRANSFSGFSVVFQMWNSYSNRRKKEEKQCRKLRKLSVTLSNVHISKQQVTRITGNLSFVGVAM